MLFRLRKGPVSGYTRKSPLGKIVRVSGYNRPDNETSQEWETEYTVPWAVPMVDPRPSKTERMSPEAFCKRMDGWQMSDQRLLWSGPDKSQELLARDYVVGEKTWRVGYDGNGKVTAAIAWRRRPGRGGTAEVCEYWEGGQAPTVKGPMATLLWSLTYDNAQIVSGKKQSETVDAIWKDLGTTAYDTVLDKIRPGDGYPRHRIRRVQTNTLFDVPHSATDDAQEDQLSLFKSVIAPKVVTRNGKTFTVRGYTDKRTRKPEGQKTGRVRKPEEQKTGRVRKPEEPTPGRSGTEAAYKAKTKRPDGSTLYEYTEEHIEAAAKAKFSRAKRLSEARDELNAALTSEMARSDTPRDKVVAAIVMLMDRCQFRIGSEKYARKNKTYGVTTFRPEHVTVTGSSIRFAFTGKTGVAWDRTLEDPELAKFMKHLLRNADDKVFWCHTKGGGQGSVTASHVNSWLQQFGVTAKDFRTYHASNLCYEHLKALSRKPDEPALSKKETAKRVKEAVKKTAEQLGHTPAVSRQSYILPEIIADFEANGGMLSKPLWDHVKSLSKSLKSFDYQGALADNETTREFDAYLKALGKKQHGSLLKSLSRLLKGRVRAHTRTLKSGKVVQVREHPTKVQKKPKPASLPRRRATAAEVYKALGTRSPYFKAWFGDWEHDPENASKVVDPETGEPKETYGSGSKVVDDEGKPVVVHHGTQSEFHSFDKDAVSPYSLYGPGFYFTEEKGMAEEYGQLVKSVYLNIRQPFRVGELTQEDFDRLADLAGELGIEWRSEAPDWGPEEAETPEEWLRLMPAFLEDQGGTEFVDLGDDMETEQWMAALWEYADIDFSYPEDLPMVLSYMGYDGITHISGDHSGIGHHHRVWIAFEPNQIKAVDNEGAFDINTDDIYKALADPLTPSERRAADWCVNIADRFGVYPPNQPVPERVRKAIEDESKDEGEKKPKNHFTNTEIREMGLKWVTAHPNGQEPGVPILVKDLGDEYVVVGGAGGKMNFTRFRKRDGEGEKPKRERKPKKPEREITEEEKQQLEEAKDAKTKAASALRRYVMENATDPTVSQVTQKEREKIMAHAMKKASELDLGDAATKEFVNAYLKRHEKEKKAAYRTAVDQVIGAALDAQAEEALTGVMPQMDDIPVAPTSFEQETETEGSGTGEGGGTGETPRPKPIKLTEDQVRNIASLAAAQAQATDTYASMRKELKAGDERTIRNVELAYKPMTDEEVKQYAVDRYIKKAEIATNAELVDRTANASRGMARHILDGSADTSAGVASALCGSTILDSATAKALGVQGTAQVTARYLVEKLGNADKLAEGLREYIGTTSSATAASAVKEAQRLAGLADEMVQFGKGEDALMNVQQALGKRLEYINAAQLVLGRAMGSLQAASHVALALESGNWEAPVLVAGRSTEAATREKAKAMGLERADYSVTRDPQGGEYNISIKPDAVSKLYNEQSLEQYQADAEVERIKEEAYDKDGFADWEPDGQSDKIILEPYQKGNIQFWEAEKRVLIADEAGAGKTATALCGIAHLHEQGKVKKSLLVVPKSVADQFGDEAKRFLDPKYHDDFVVASGGTPAKRKEAYGSGKLFTVITHDQMRNDREAIAAAGFDAVVVDEAHYFTVRDTSKSGEGNEGSQRSRAARELTKNTPYVMLMTGTPIKNDMSELHSIADWLQPGCLGSRKSFMERFGAIASQEGIANEALLAQLSKRLSKVMMGVKLTTEVDRSTDQKVVSLKPNVKSNDPIRGTENTRWVDLTPQQHEKYKAEEDAYLQARDAHAKGAGFTRDQHLDATVNNVNIEDHPKVLAMREDLAKHPDQKAVIFASNGYSWRTIIKGLGLKEGEYRLLNGGTTGAQRQKYRDEINDENSPVKYLIASDAANFGMNLQGASVLINFDCSDTFATHEQRIKRCLRKGQKHDVSVYNYRTRTPLEIKAQRRIERKEKVASIVHQLQQVDGSGLARTVGKFLNLGGK